MFVVVVVVVFDGSCTVGSIPLSATSLTVNSFIFEGEATMKSSSWLKIKQRRPFLTTCVLLDARAFQFRR